MKIGFIGSGHISNFHIKALKENGFEIAAIGTRKSSKNCKEFAEKLSLLDKYCEDGWEEVMESEVDAFCLCIDITNTPKILKKILDKNKPILVEKPVAWKPHFFNAILEHPFKKIFSLVTTEDFMKLH